MQEATETFVAVLEKERDCALRADVDGLSVVQEEKRQALALLLNEQPSEDDLAFIRAHAYENVRLIRHLMTCLQGILAPQGATYTADGEIPLGSPGRSRGRL
jgi:hypothetical protein